MSDQASSQGSLYSKVQLAVARISSSNRNNGTFNNFSVFLTPQVSRCIGFYVASIMVYNDWYTIDSNHNTSYWKLNSGSIIPVTMTAGYYDETTAAANENTSAGAMFAEEFQSVLNSALGLGPTDITVQYHPIENVLVVVPTVSGMLLTYYTTSNGLSTGTAATMTGILPDLVNGQTATEGGSPDEMVSTVLPNFYDPVFIDISSPQLRQPISIDTRTNGGTNTFLHLNVDKPKLVPITQVNLSPTDMSITKYPGPQEFQLLQLTITDPNTGLPLDLGQNWEVVINFLIIQ